MVILLELPTQRRFNFLRKNLGVINKNTTHEDETVKKHRNAKLAVLKAYYDGKAYEHKKDWFKARKNPRRYL